MKTVYIVILLTLCVCQLHAQKQIWEKDLKEELYQVGWIEQVNDGTVIAAGAKGLLALDSNTGETIWYKEDLKSIDKTSFQNIGYLPLFYVEYSSLTGKKRGVIINSHSGEIIFDTKEEEYKVKHFTFLPEQEMILFELEKEKNRFLMSFSLKTWTENWTSNLGKSNQGLIKRFLNNSFIKHSPQFDNKNNMIVGTNEEMFCINLKNGSIQWQQEASNDIKALVYSPINNSLYLGVKKSNKLTVLNPQTGEDITPGKLKLRGYMIDLVKGNNDELIMVETEGFNIINPRTNEFKWKKSAKIEPISEVIPFNNEYIAIGKDEKDGKVARFNAEGKNVWEQKIKGYAYYVQKTQKGVLYISTERSNILEFEKGKEVWKKDVKFKSIPAVTYDTKEDKVVIFENGEGYKFDLTSGEITQFAESIELQEVKRKTPLEAEYVENQGYFLYTDQHLSLITPNGDVKYTNYYQPPSENDALFALGNLAGAYFGVDLDIKGSIENIKALQDMSNGVFRERLDQNDVNTVKKTSGLYVGTNSQEMTPVFEVTSKRFFNSKQTKEHQFVVTKTTQDTATKHAIYRINKSSGEIEQKIELDDKTPNYIVDDIDQRVFINQNNHFISAYSF